MATVSQVRRFGPGDHGTLLSFEEFTQAAWEEGYRYELIDGRVHASPLPDLPESWVDLWLKEKLRDYARANPKVINLVAGPGRVFIPSRLATTAPEPDVLAYRNFPLRRRKRDLRWQDVSPILVGEILSSDDPAKDLIRNVALYLLVPSIKEYWILDARADADYPSLRVYRRRASRWQMSEVGPREDYTTPLLPGFRLTLDTNT